MARVKQTRAESEKEKRLKVATVQDHLDIAAINNQSQDDDCRSSIASSNVDADFSGLNSKPSLTISDLSKEFGDCCPEILSSDFVMDFLEALVEVLSEFEVDRWNSLDLDSSEVMSVAGTEAGTKKASVGPTWYKIAKKMIDGLKSKYASSDTAIPKQDNFRGNKGFIKWFKQTNTKGNKKSQLRFATLLSGYIVKLAYCRVGLGESGENIRELVGGYIYDLALNAHKKCDLFKFVPVLSGEALKVYKHALSDTSTDLWIHHVIGNAVQTESAANRKVNDWWQKEQNKGHAQYLQEEDSKKSYEERIKWRKNRIEELEKEIDDHHQSIEDKETEISTLNQEIKNLEARDVKEKNNNKVIERFRTVVAAETEETFVNIVESIIETVTPFICEKLKFVGCDTADKSHVEQFCKQIVCSFAATSTSSQALSNEKEKRRSLPVAACPSETVVDSLNKNKRMPEQIETDVENETADKSSKKRKGDEEEQINPKKSAKAAEPNPAIRSTIQGQGFGLHKLNLIDLKKKLGK